MGMRIQGLSSLGVPLRAAEVSTDGHYIWGPHPLQALALVCEEVLGGALARAVSVAAMRARRGAIGTLRRQPAWRLALAAISV